MFTVKQAMSQHMLENHKMGRAVRFLSINDVNVGQEKTDRWSMKVTVIIQASKNKEWSQKANWNFYVSHQDKFDKEWKNEKVVILQVFIRYVRCSFMKKNVKVLRIFKSISEISEHASYWFFVRLIIIKHFETASVISFPPDPLSKYRQNYCLNKSKFLYLISQV